jgi:ribosomal protein L7/L12
MQAIKQVGKHIFGLGWLLDPFGIGAARKQKVKDAAALDKLLGTNKEQFDPHGEKGDAPDDPFALERGVEQALTDLGYENVEVSLMEYGGDTGDLEAAILDDDLSLALSADDGDTAEDAASAAAGEARMASVLTTCRGYIEEGKKVNAIKHHREHTGLGLKESKALIDDLSDEMKAEAAQCQQADQETGNA